MVSYRFPRQQRLRRQFDFDRVHQGSAYAADEVLVVRGARNELSQTRIGISISRKTGNAVTRNRWKRLIREAFRLEQTRLPRGLDLVVRPRKGAGADAAAIRRSLPQLVGRVASRLQVRK